MSRIIDNRYDNVMEKSPVPMSSSSDTDSSSSNSSTESSSLLSDGDIEQLPHNSPLKDSFLPVVSIKSEKIVTENSHPIHPNIPIPPMLKPLISTEKVFILPSVRDAPICGSDQILEDANWAAQYEDDSEDREMARSADEEEEEDEYQVSRNGSEESDGFEEDNEAMQFGDTAQAKRNGMHEYRLEVPTRALEYSYPDYLAKIATLFTDQFVFGDRPEQFIHCNNLMINPRLWGEIEKTTAEAECILIQKKRKAKEDAFALERKRIQEKIAIELAKTLEQLEDGKEEEKVSSPLASSTLHNEASFTSSTTMSCEPQTIEFEAKGSNKRPNAQHNLEVKVGKAQKQDHDSSPNTLNASSIDTKEQPKPVSSGDESSTSSSSGSDSSSSLSSDEME